MTLSRNTHRTSLALCAALLTGPSAMAQVFDVKTDATTAQFSPAVAYNQGVGGVERYGVAFTDATDTGCGTNECTQNVTGVLLDGNAVRLGTTSISATPNTDDKEPAVSFDSTNNRFLIAYYVKDNAKPCANSVHRVRGNVFVKVIDVNGNVLYGPFNVSNTTSSHNVRVRAAWDPVTQKHLVVWETALTSAICSAIDGAGNNLGLGLARSPWHVRAVILNANGTSYSSVFIPSIKNDTYIQQNPSVAANTNSGGWLVVWGDKRFIQDNNNSVTEAVFGQRIDSRLAYPYRVDPTWDPIIGDTSPGQDRFPRVAFNPEDNQWLAVWYSARGAYDDDQSGTIYAQRMRADGFWEGCPGACPFNVYNVLTDGRGHGHPDVVYCPPTDKYWIAWQTDQQGTDPKTLVMRYKPFNRTLGYVADSVGYLGTKGPAFPQTCRASDGRTALIYESYYYEPLGDIRGRFIQ